MSAGPLVSLLWSMCGGGVDRRAVKLYLSSMSGGYSFLFWVCVIGFLLVCEFLGISQTYWLGYWAQQYEDHDQEEVKVF